MKRIKTLSVFMAVLMLFGVFSIGAGAIEIGGFEIYPYIPPQTANYSIVFNPCCEGPDSYTKYYYSSEVTLPTYVEDGSYVFKRDGYALAGWTDEEGGKVKYCKGEKISLQSFDGTVLYAVWCPIVLSPDEVFRFNNSSYYFDINGEDNYYLSDDNFNMLQKNTAKVFLLSPIPASIYCLVLSTYPSWEWKGSCYGMSLVTALQHFGKIDVLKLQEAGCMNDMVNDEELISFINYYQAQAASSYLCENRADKPGSARYKRQLEKLYNSVESGKLVIFTFYDGKSIISSGHTVLFTGAYTDSQGYHHFITYDCNYPSRYYNGTFSSEFTAEPDFSSIAYPYHEIEAINWTDEFSQFDAFDINGGGKPLTWHKAFFKHVANILK